MGRIGLRELEHLFIRYSRFHQKNLTIDQFTTFGKSATVKDSFAFLRHEVPTRLAHIMKELNNLPNNLRATPSVSIVREWYNESFADMMEFQDLDDSEQTTDDFMQKIIKIKQRHSDVVNTMAQGILELKQLEGEKAFEPPVQYFLDRFYMNRISVRMLMDQHLALFRPEFSKSSKTKFVGLIDSKCDVQEIAFDAAQTASDLCDHYYLRSPNIKVKTFNAVDNSDGVHFAYVPSHLHHILFELVKNAMRATVETHAGAPDLPIITIDIVKGKHDLTVRVSDEGGGIPRSNMDKLFLYHYSTASPPEDVQNLAAFAGYGYGLPLSRVYARYFGGDLVIASIEGLGTQAFVYLKSTPTDAVERLLAFNKSVEKNYKALSRS